MHRLSVAVEKINSLSAILYLIGLGFYYGSGYPDWLGALILLTGFVWLVRQFLLGRMLDCLFVLIVFGSSWTSHYWDFYPHVVIPGLLAAGALYVIIEQVVSYLAAKKSCGCTHRVQYQKKDEENVSESPHS